MNNLWKYTLVSLLLTAITLAFALASSQNSNLQIIACDVGQGDATLIQNKDTQILIDGGPNNEVLDCLESYMPFWDKTIELIVLTHPQHDHYFGLIEVLNNYNTNLLVRPEAENSTQGFELLKKTIGSRRVKVYFPNTPTKLKLGLISLDILHPPRHYSSSDLNDYSVVANLSYGSFDALLTGDISPKVIKQITDQGLVGDVEYLKVPHHGSKNGLTQALITHSSPEIATISSGKKNRFGHPHSEVISILEDNNIDYLITAKEGEIVIESDGKSFWVVK